MIDPGKALRSLIKRRYDSDTHPQFFNSDGSPNVGAFTHSKQSSEEASNAPTAAAAALGAAAAGVPTHRRVKKSFDEDFKQIAKIHRHNARLEAKDLRMPAEEKRYYADVDRKGRKSVLKANKKAVRVISGLTGLAGGALTGGAAHLVKKRKEAAMNKEAFWFGKKQELGAGGKVPSQNQLLQDIKDGKTTHKQARKEGRDAHSAFINEVLHNYEDPGAGSMSPAQARKAFKKYNPYFDDLDRIDATHGAEEILGIKQLWKQAAEEKQKASNVPTAIGAGLGATLAGGAMGRMAKRDFDGEYKDFAKSHRRTARDMVRRKKSPLEIHVQGKGLRTLRSRVAKENKKALLVSTGIASLGGGLAGALPGFTVKKLKERKMNKQAFWKGFGSQHSVMQPPPKLPKGMDDAPGAFINEVADKSMSPAQARKAFKKYEKHFDDLDRVQATMGAEELLGINDLWEKKAAAGNPGDTQISAMKPKLITPKPTVTRTSSLPIPDRSAVKLASGPAQEYKDLKWHERKRPDAGALMGMLLGAGAGILGVKKLQGRVKPPRGMEQKGMDGLLNTLGGGVGLAAAGGISGILGATGGAGLAMSSMPSSKREIIRREIGRQHDEEEKREAGVARVVRPVQTKDGKEPSYVKGMLAGTAQGMILPALLGGLATELQTRKLTKGMVDMVDQASPHLTGPQEGHVREELAKSKKILAKKVRRAMMTPVGFGLGLGALGGALGGLTKTYDQIHGDQ